MEIGVPALAEICSFPSPHLAKWAPPPPTSRLTSLPTKFLFPSPTKD